ncbi:beta-ketoacyl-[acyl-carrier-protein] synthase family protein [Streptomyces sp. NPDC047000]|uniref:beta-ketoacyl-[acyl-carrier-protein] synthase family protein n=1 Tax=Streptomyces sp. NPDC047000 TaxID=3155474 RepID=UPI0033EA8FD7
MSDTARHTAVVTGIGLITALGQDLRTTFEALCAGRSGLRRPPADHVVAGSVDVAGIAPAVAAADVLPPSEGRSVDRYVLLALAAADAALADAGIEIGRDVDPWRTGVVVSSGGAGLETYEDQARARHQRGRTAISPYLLPGMLPNMAAARIAIKYGAHGHSAAIATACAAGAQSVAEALRLIRAGDADIVVCGGADAPLHPTIADAFGNARALARGWDDPRAASRPFDERRNGFVLAEGSAVLVVERAEHARARGAAGYADLLGWGATTDAYRPTAPRPDGLGAVNSMRRALTDAGLAPSDVDYVNAHGTGTKVGDIAEAKAVRAVFGDRSPAVSATKSMTGHLLGGAGAVEAGIVALSLAEGLLPPTRNLDTVGPGCELDHITGKSRDTRVTAAVSNSFAFGGHNITLAFGQSSIPVKRLSRTTEDGHG